MPDRRSWDWLLELHAGLKPEARGPLPLRGDGRPDRYLVDGEQVPSVTTVLRAWAGVGGSEALMRWYGKLGYEAGHAHGLEGKEPMKQGWKAAELERDRAAAVGTAVHHAIDAFFGHEPIEAVEGVLQDLGTEESRVQARTAWHSFSLWWEAFWAPRLDQGWKMVATESPLVHAKGFYGGTTDGIAENAEGELVVIDWKTSSRSYTNHVYQCAAYGAAWESQEGDDPPVSGAIITRFDKKTPRGEWLEVPPEMWVNAGRRWAWIRKLYYHDREIEKAMRAFKEAAKEAR